MYLLTPYRGGGTFRSLEHGFSFNNSAAASTESDETEPYEVRAEIVDNCFARRAARQARSTDPLERLFACYCPDQTV